MLTKAAQGRSGRTLALIRASAIHGGTPTARISNPTRIGTPYAREGDRLIASVGSLSASVGIVIDGSSVVFIRIVPRWHDYPSRRRAREPSPRAPEVARRRNAGLSTRGMAKPRTEEAHYSSACGHRDATAGVPVSLSRRSRPQVVTQTRTKPADMRSSLTRPMLPRTLCKTPLAPLPCSRGLREI